MALGTRCPTLYHGLFQEHKELWGVFGVAGALQLGNLTIAIGSRKQEALGATLRSSYRINVSQVQRNFCAAHVNLGFTNFFLGAKARARHEQEFDERTTIWPCKSQKRDGTRVQNCCESASGWDEPIHFLFAL